MGVGSRSPIIGVLFQLTDSIYLWIVPPIYITDPSHIEFLYVQGYFTLCAVAHLEKSRAENFWSCALAGIRVGDRRRPGARAADHCDAGGQEPRRVRDLPFRRQDGSGREPDAWRVESDR